MAHFGFAIVSIFFLMVTQAPASQIDRHQCCQQGSDFGSQSWLSHGHDLATFSRQCTIKSMRSFVNLPGKDRQSIPRKCQIIARSCCLKLVKRKICLEGALQNGNCDSPIVGLSMVMAQIRSECCFCCEKNGTGLINEFESCSLLKGKCPRMPQPTVSTGEGTTSTSISTQPWNTADSETSSLTEGITTESPELVTDDTIASIDTIESTISPSDDVKPITRSQLSTDVMESSNPSTATTEGPISCDNDQKWNPRLHACVQLIISCPPNFILHPRDGRCVEIIQPSEPCPEGYRYNQFEKLCVDIDECVNASVCRSKLERCVNTIGSFQCKCQKGYRHNKLRICEDIDECVNASICSKEQKCKNTEGSYKCIRAIPCGFGWKEDPDTNDCIDIDECDIYPDICGSGMKCINIRGSHKCEDDECPNDMKRNNRGICSRCSDGFLLNNDTQLCEDINECITSNGWPSNRCKDTEVCLNLDGSFECVPKKKCRSGTTLTRNGTACEDINECKMMRFRCETDQICVNTYSSYQCVASPCAPSQQYEYDTSKCVCRDGYQLARGDICTDIDECAQHGPEFLCGSRFICINHPGSYSCIHKDECPTGMFRSSMYSSCQDVDECETGEGKCPLNMHCVNMVGSYKCMCNRGYTMLSNNTCADVNECLLFRPEESCPDLEARCVNTPGSYKCQCPKGFQWSDYPIKKCTDINECHNSNPCGKKHECVNTLGSYKCNCFKGYRLSISGENCEDIDECQQDPRKCINGFCMNIPGKYACKCPLGFALDANEICQDIDECASFDEVCRVSDDQNFAKTCLNLMGYYKCVNSSCPPEYEKKETGTGFMCILIKDRRCLDEKCLLQKPYRKHYEFIEISSSQIRRNLSHLNLTYLPPGISRMNLKMKYAYNTDTKESISIHNVFELVSDRFYRDNIYLVMKKSVPAPAEILLYLEVNRFRLQQYLGHSQAFIHLYLTKYPLIPLL